MEDIYVPEKPKLEIASESKIPEDEIVTAPGPEGVPTKEELDEEEQEFRALRRDLPGVKGASAAGIVAISVGKTPAKNEFFRAHHDVPADRADRRSRGRDGEAILRRHRRHGRGPERHRHHRHRPRAVSDHHVARRHPHRAGAAGQCDGEQNEYHRTKEIGLIQGIRRMGAAVHRPGKPLLQGVSCAGRTLRRAAMARSEAGEDLQAGVPRQGPPDRQRRAPAFQEVGGP